MGSKGAAGTSGTQMRTNTSQDIWSNNYQTTDQMTAAFSNAGADSEDYYATHPYEYENSGAYDFSMPSFDFEMPEMADYSAIFAQQTADATSLAAKSQIDSLYGSKFDAAEKAIADVNQQIADEMGHAKLVGLDYSVDDVSKQARIDDLFATYWGESDDMKLNSLTQKYGNNGYEWDLPVKRGTAQAEKDKEKTPGDKAGEKVTAKGPKLKAEEDPLGLLKTTLG
jgi:hypothetical protein